MSEKKQNPFILAVKDIIAGTIGGIGLVFAGHPFDTIKVNIFLFFIYFVFLIVQDFRHSLQLSQYTMV